jgi:hypothetical protein
LILSLGQGNTELCHDARAEDRVASSVVVKLSDSLPFSFTADTAGALPNIGLD